MERELPRVRILNDIVVNQIAAGEVVERPSSVVKELVENSIDAQSTHITVAVSNGGKTSIEVLDNGHGMSREDALLAVERFGTSKIRASADLESIRTLGFRGEALPSIASVSRFSLETRSAASDAAGVHISINGGVLKDVSDKHMPVGTRIRVQQLFFNVPARKKFLRSETTEVGFVKSLLADFALAYPQIRFGLVVDGKEVLNYPEAADFDARVQQVGLAGATSLMVDRKVTFDGQMIWVRGSISRPIDAVGTGLRLRLLVNGRSVRDPMLLRAVREGYGSYLKPGKYPKGVITVQIPFTEVDVNVHPQKTEVRFRTPSDVFRAIVQAVHQALIDVEPEVTRPAERSATAQNPELFAGDRFDSFSRSAAPSWTPGKLFDSSSAAPAPVFSGSGALRKAFVDDAELPGISWDQAASTEQIVATPPPVAVESAVVSLPAISGEPALLQGLDSNSLRYVGQIFELYLLFESHEQFFIIDMHAAHERVTFYRLRKQFMEGSIRSQLLLVPETIDMEPDRLEAFDRSKETLARLGIECEMFGEETIVVRGMPALLGAVSAKSLFSELLALPEWENWDSLVEERIDEVLVRMSCHGSVRSGRLLNRDEVHALVDTLIEAESSAFCPHGRPTSIRLSARELENMFGRVGF